MCCELHGPLAKPTQADQAFGSLLPQKKYAEAEPLVLKGYEGLKERKWALAQHQTYRLPDALARLVQLYDTWGKPDEAARWRKEMDATTRR